MRNRSLALLALCALLLPCGYAVAQEEEQVLTDTWALLRLAGQDVGWAHNRTVKKGDLVETSVETRMVMRRMGAEIKVEQNQNSVEQAATGKLVSMHTKMKMSAVETEMRVRFEGEKAIVTTISMGQERDTEMKCPAGTVGPHRIEQLTKETGFKSGAIIETTMFALDMGGARKLTVTVSDPAETTMLDGTKRTLVPVRTVFVGFPLKPVSWFESDGRLVKMEIPMAGLNMEMFTTSKERAMGGGAGKQELPPDVFDKTLIRSRYPVPQPRRLDAALLRIRSKEEMPAFETGRQNVESSSEGEVMLRISRVVPPAPPYTGAERPAELADCLAANSMIQSDAPEIIELAKKAVGDETDPWKKAQVLESWVHKNLTEKNMNVGFASALEVCRNREGDCSEHAVLLAAMCRAVDVPARVVMGVVYFSGVWGGHAWNDVWIDGRWYQLDATQGRGSVDPVHLTLSTMTLKDGEFGQEFTNLLLGLGNLEIDVLEVTYRGRTVRLEKPAGAVQGDRYVNRLWGLTFTRPSPEWEFDLPSPGGAARMSNKLLELDGKSSAGEKCEIEIEASDAPVDLTLKKLRAQLARRAVDFEEIDVDGRPALRGSRDRNGRKSQGVYVLANGTLYVFELDRIDGDAEVAAFEAFLASVDFDIE